ncbi:hypothetical protein RUND412_000484 [Rhizina undulata]
MSQKPPEEELLKRPLYVYDLPANIASTLISKDAQKNPAETFEEAPRQQDGELSSATSCTFCGVTSATVADQRQHARSDFHRFNLKRKVRGQPPLSEVEFERVIEELSESISGSDSESGSEPSEAEDLLSTVLEKKARISDTPARKPNPGKAPIHWFTTPLLPSNYSLGVYRALFPTEITETFQVLSTLKSKQLSPTSKNPPHIFLCMIGGGHFAAMIISLAPKPKNARSTSNEREALVLAHKTFHRYTTRRKQGGSQSANDAAKGNAHSAGSSLRRYNEAALTNEVRELLASWKDMLHSSELLFIRATGNSNRKAIFNYEDAPLKSSDPRIRGFPFTTRRATQGELMRCFLELTRVKISTISSESLAELSEPVPAPEPKPQKPAPKKPSKEEEDALFHTSQLTSLIRRSKAPAVLSYITSNNLPPDYIFFPANHHSPTPLHFAAASNSPAVVIALLTKASADPTLYNADQKTAFELAGDRATRDAFRIARLELGENKWDWEVAKIPAGISRSQAEQREKKEKEESEKEERERRDREMKRLKEETEKERGKGKGLGRGVLGTSLGRMEEEARGLSAEARMRLDRERRARAAEERIRKMAGGR